MAFPTTIIVIGLTLIALCLIVWARSSNSIMEGFMPSGLATTPAKFSCDIEQNKSQQGLAWFKRKRLVICALLRDSEGSIDLLRRQAEAVGSLFSDYAVLIVENDSHDSTRTKLLEWAKSNRKVRILGCEGINLITCHMNLDQTLIHDRDFMRIEKMVLLRNLYLDYLRSDSRLSQFDLALIWDLDIQGALYVDGIGLTGYYMSKGVNGVIPDAICANGIAEAGDPIETGKYYDPYAHEDIGQTRTFTTVDDINPPKCNNTPIAVRSCFNGFMFYRLSALLEKRYVLEKVGKEAICEHVPVHRGMNVFLNPGMLYLMDYHNMDPWDITEIN